MAKNARRKPASRARAGPRPRVICLGHAALDRIYQIDAFPPAPTKVRAKSFVEVGGGMAANAAVAVARLGGDVSLWSRVGDDLAGALILEGFRVDGVDATHVRRFPGTRSSTSAIIVDARGERLIVSDRAEMALANPGWLPLADVASASAVLADKRWPEGTLALFARARQEGVPTLLDADVGLRKQMTDMLRLTDYAIFAAPALDEFLGEGSDAERLQHVVERFGCRHAGVTRGAEGYLWCGQDGVVQHQPAFKVAVVDTTGAGDAFHGAFVFAVASGMEVAQCARLASAVAALKCTKLGGRAGLPTLEEAEGFMRERTHRS